MECACCMPNMKSHCSKFIGKVKVDNRQTRREDKQDKNNMPLIIQYGGIKMSAINAASDALDSHTSWALGLASGLLRINESQHCCSIVRIWFTKNQ